MAERLVNKQIRVLEEEHVKNCENINRLHETLKCRFGLNPEITLELLLSRQLEYHCYAVDKLRESVAKRTGNSHVWIGINPPPGSITLGKLYDKMENCVKTYKFFSTGYMYCMEAHTQNGVRPHVHLMLTTNTKPHRLLEQISHHFNIKKQSVDIKKYHHDIAFNEHVNYLLGNKKSSKTENVEEDRILRAELEIPEYLGEMRQI